MTVLRAQRRLDYLSRDPAPTMGQVERLGSGGLRIPASFTRIGVFHYQEQGRWIGELRLPEEVFAAESLASLRGLPLTLLHPPGAVTRDLWPLVARGHVCEDVHVDGIHVRGHVVAAHPELCLGIESGDLCELSGGYTADCEISSGDWQGIPYERIQRRIRYDHVAVGPRDWARGGPTVRLMLDGGARHGASPARGGGAPRHARGRSMTTVPLLTGGARGRLETHYRADCRAGEPMSLKFLRDKRTVEVGDKSFDLTKPAELAAAKDAARADNKRRDGLDPDAAIMALEEMRGHLDMANQLALDAMANLVDADVAAEEAMSPEQLDAAMQEYADCVTRARALAPSLDTKGKSVEQIQREALAARGHKTDGETADYVRGAFRNATSTVTFRADDLAAMGDGTKGAGQATGNGKSALSGAWQKNAGKGAA